MKTKLEKNKIEYEATIRESENKSLNTRKKEIDSGYRRIYTQTNMFTETQITTIQEIKNLKLISVSLSGDNKIYLLVKTKVII